MSDVGLGYTNANIPYMQKIILQALKAESCEEKDTLLHELNELLDEMADRIFENAFKA